MLAAVAGPPGAAAGLLLAVASAVCAAASSGFGHQVDAQLVASLPGVGQLVSSGEVVGDGSGPFGVDLAAGELDELDSFGADGGQPVVEVEDALPEAASFVGGVELVAVDAGPDAGAGDVQAEAVVAAGFVGDAGELQGGALAPAQLAAVAVRCGSGRRRVGAARRSWRSGR